MSDPDAESLPSDPTDAGVDALPGDALAGDPEITGEGAGFSVWRPWQRLEQEGWAPDQIEDLKRCAPNGLGLLKVVRVVGQYFEGTLAPADLELLIRLGICYQRRRGWTVSADHLERWLDGSAADPAHLSRGPLLPGDSTEASYVPLDPALFRAEEGFLAVLADAVWPVIQAGVRARLDGSYQRQTVDVCDGRARWDTGENTLVTGADHVLLKEEAVDDAWGSPAGDPYYALGAVGVLSRVTVAAERLDASRWRITVRAWELRVWDHYDWNDLGQAVRIQIGPRELRVGDQTMLDLEKTGYPSGGGTVHPAPYLLVSEWWSLDLAAADIPSTWIVEL